MYIVLLIICAIFAGCSSVSIKDVTGLRTNPAMVFLDVQTDVPHSRHELTLLKKETVSALNKERIFSVCIRDTEETDRIAETVYLCKENVIDNAFDSTADVRVVIESIKGVSNTGNVYGGLLEGRGEVMVSIEIDTEDSRRIYTLSGKGKTEQYAGIKLARGIDDAIKKIAASIPEIVHDNISN